MFKPEELYVFRVKNLWKQFWQESFAFWMICGYLFFEYVRPHSIIPELNFMPWMSIFLALSAIGLLFDKRRKWVSDSANKWIIAFLMVIIASTFNAYWPVVSKQKLEFIYTWIIIYFLIVNIVNTPQRFYVFLLIFCLASFKLSLHGAQVWTFRGFGFTKWGITGPPGFFRNSGELSIQMLCFFPLGFYLYQELKDRARTWEKLVLILFFVTPVMTILGASSRGAQLALAIQCILMFYRKIFRVKVILTIAAIIFLTITFLPEEQKQRFAEMGEDKTSQQRLLYWENGIEIIKEHPLLGIGFFNFIPYYENHYRGDMLYPHAELPHNIFIQIGTDAGLIGLSIYILLLLRFSRRPSGRYLDDPVYRASSKGIAYGMIGFVVAGQFVTVGYYPYMWIGLALFVALQNSFRESHRNSGDGWKTLRTDQEQRESTSYNFER